MKRKILTTVALVLLFGIAFGYFGGIDGQWSRPNFHLRTA